LTAEWSALASLEAPPEAVLDLRRFLHGFWIHQFGRLPGRRKESR